MDKNKLNIPNQEEIWDTLADSWNERRKEIGPGILRFIQESKGNFLDLGCGSGRHLIKNDRVKFYLVDFSQNMLNLAGKKAKKLNIKYKTFKKEADNLSIFEDNFFDAALYVATIHCLTTEKKRKKSLRELYRVLKKGARAYVSVWNKENPEFKKRYGKKKEQLLAWNFNGKRNLRYYYFYDKDEFLHDLESVRFKIIEVKDHKEDTGLFVLVEKP